MPSFQDLLDEHAVASWDKQESLFRLMGGEHDWRIDLDSGTLILTNQVDSYALPIQWLGSVYRDEKRWVWSWANDRLNVDDSLKQAAVEIRRFGETHGIPEFTQSELSTDTTNGDLIALVASGLCEADGYYLCEMEQGAEYFVFQSEDVRNKGDNNPVRCMNVFLSILPHIDLSHRPALIHFLEHKGYSCLEAGSKMVATSEAGEIHTGFDDLGRIVEINTKTPSQARNLSESPSQTRPQVDV